MRCTLPAHEETTLPLSLLPLLWLLPLQLPSLSLLPSPTPLPLPLPSLVPSPIAVAVAVGHRRWGCRHPLPPLSLLCCHHKSPLPLPLPLAIAVSVTVGHHSCHLHWPLPLPSPLAIAKSCCLDTARIVSKQFKQIMLTLFYFVQTVGGALIKPG